ncbi:MAG TPA: 16S rRNA pseudouridine(516) synthase [Ruminococcaceae bacterium]|nr:16S rRNA pseudouridine(516) synthase [Oscillospiraceae bacterium]
MERLDKILTQRGAGSRKEVQRLIRSGAVCVNGKPCKKPETKVNPSLDAVTVGGKPVDADKFIYIMLNKPAGVVSATRDNRDKTVLDILPEEYRRPKLFPAGRLDKDTEGLLIITNDGDFAHKMLSPVKKVYKQYEAVLDGEVTDSVISAFESGITFSDGTKCLPAELRVLKEGQKNRVIVKICEGKFHQVKKMFAACGLNVVHLKRISIGNLYLDSKLTIGSCKLLTKLDIEAIFIGNIH